jgi:hypothetical protein
VPVWIAADEFRLLRTTAKKKKDSKDDEKVKE